MIEYMREVFNRCMWANGMTHHSLANKLGWNYNKCRSVLRDAKTVKIADVLEVSSVFDLEAHIIMKSKEDKVVLILDKSLEDSYVYYLMELAKTLPHKELPDRIDTLNSINNFCQSCGLQCELKFNVERTGMWYQPPMRAAFKLHKSNVNEVKESLKNLFFYQTKIRDMTIRDALDNSGLCYNQLNRIFTHHALYLDVLERLLGSLGLSLNLIIRNGSKCKVYNAPFNTKDVRSYLRDVALDKGGYKKAGDKLGISNKVFRDWCVIHTVTIDTLAKMEYALDVSIILEVSNLL